MVTFQKLSGAASIGMALIYISAFVFYGGFWHFPFDADAASKIAYLREHQLVISSVTFFIYIFCGFVLAILVVGMHKLLAFEYTNISFLAAIFGGVWVGLVIATGMISNAGLAFIIELGVTEPKKAIDTWRIFMVIADSIGGGNEIVGGVWVLIISFLALRSAILPKGIHYLGIFVGLVGVLTTYPASILTDIFGICQLVWFLCLGIALINYKQ